MQWSVDDDLHDRALAKGLAWKPNKYLLRLFWILRFAADPRPAPERLEDCAARVRAIPRDEDRQCTQWMCEVLFADTAARVPPGVLESLAAWIALRAGCPGPLAPGDVFDAVHRCQYRLDGRV